jgi:hypothetical protein
MAKVLESLIARGRRARRPPEQKEVAFGLADLSTHGDYFCTVFKYFVMMCFVLQRNCWKEWFKRVVLNHCLYY